MTRSDPRRFVQICWIGLATAAAVGTIAGIFKARIESDSWLTLLMVLGLLPAGIVHLTLLWQLVERYRWWCLMIFVLLPWPTGFLLAMLLVPVAFLALITHRIYADTPKMYPG